MSTLLGFEESAPATKKKRGRVGKTKTTNARHMAEDPNWVTSPEILAVERAMYADLGLKIDLDPYSCAEANLMVGAERIWTEADDGTSKPWDAQAMHINHPGGMTIEAWMKVVNEVRAGRTKRATWIGFSVEQLALLADPAGSTKKKHKVAEYPHPMDFSCVILRNRIGFVKQKDVVRILAGEKIKGRPGHSNYIVVINVDQKIVDKHWNPLGRVFHGRFSGIQSGGLAVGAP